jgi:hypothetical protein
MKKTDLPRPPKVENKYNLSPKDIQKAIILDKEKLTKAPFWRNNVISAWCLSGEIKPNPRDYYGIFNLSYWIGFYDEDAKSYAGKIRLSCTSYGGMCGYNFKKFYNPLEIEDEFDLQLQEALLEKINWLIDDGIIEIPKK